MGPENVFRWYVVRTSMESVSLASFVFLIRMIAQAPIETVRMESALACVVWFLFSSFHTYHVTKDRLFQWRVRIALAFTGACAWIPLYANRGVIPFFGVSLGTLLLVWAVGRKHIHAELQQIGPSASSFLLVFQAIQMACILAVFASNHPLGGFFGFAIAIWTFTFAARHMQFALRE